MVTQQQRQIIRRARDLIAEPTRWCQSDFALDEEGERCHPNDPKARKFCACGAIQRAAHDLDMYPHLWFRPSQLGVINNRGHKAVLDFFDKALAFD
jgi:hypothetical protein